MDTFEVVHKTRPRCHYYTQWLMKLDHRECLSEK